MDTKTLMSGIAVAIDDAFGGKSGAGGDTEVADLIRKIVGWFEEEWQVSFVKTASVPKAQSRPNLLGAASFVLLDWRLWGSGGETLRGHTIAEIKEFLASARENLVPVFILTNESPDEVTAELSELPDAVYDQRASATNFVFVERKDLFWTGKAVDVGKLENWVYGNASVYALKTWERVLDGAKRELFQAMCGRSVNWPRVFWDTYGKDHADPSASLTSLINDSLRGRMRADAFEEKRLGGQYDDVSDEELRRLIAETSFRSATVLPEDEVRCGDLYKGAGGKYWLNVRPDCDCIPRDGGDIGSIDVYCVRGKKLSSRHLADKFKNGHFVERVSESVVFGVVEGKSILFKFDRLSVYKYSEMRDQRVGRLLHPYVTRVQQRYALYIQRQALPRIPDAAVAPTAQQVTSSPAP